MSITAELRRIIEDHQTLTVDEAAALMRRLLAGDADEVQIAALLAALSSRGETADEIAGFALAMREVAATLPLTPAEQAELVDTCGTGGDGSDTFNISTAAALVAAAAGAKVAKHGNRAVTSRCGSADVLEALGIPVDLTPAAAADALRRHNFCFLLASAHHPAMRAVMPVRRALGVRTIFNVLGPLLNPAGARRQVMGVNAARLVPLVAEAMTRLSVTHAFVVHGTHSMERAQNHSVSGSVASGSAAPAGMDELSLSGLTEVAEVRSGSEGPKVSTYEVLPRDLGLTRVPVATLRGGDASENATILRQVFGVAGEPAEHGPRRDVVVLNAAAVLVSAGLAPDLEAGVTLASETIDAGLVAQLIHNLRSA